MVMSKKTVSPSLAFYPAPTGQDVFTAAVERVATLYDEYDTVVVSFSGGKDSTSVLNLAYAEAQRRGATCHVCMIDEEVIDPDTVTYVYDRVAKWPGLELKSAAVEIMHSLRSKNRRVWYTWDHEARDVWARPLPSIAQTDIPGYVRGGHYHDAIVGLYPMTEFGRVVQVTGVRASESLIRRMNIYRHGGMVTLAHKHAVAKPIYDWNVPDIWKAIYENKWDFSGYYTRFRKMGRGMNNSRVAPWGNVASIREVELFAAMYPDFWNAAIRRLPELIDIGRYGGTRLYMEGAGKPDGLTWQEWSDIILSGFDANTRVEMIERVTVLVRRWARMSNAPFPDSAAMAQGYEYSWQKIAAMLSKSDPLRSL